MPNRLDIKEFSIILYNHAKHSHYLPSMVSLHENAILEDGGILDFLPPLNKVKMLACWEKYASGTDPDGTVDIVLSIGKPDSYIGKSKSNSSSSGVEPTKDVSGPDYYLSLDKSMSDSVEQVLGVMVLAGTPYETRRFHPPLK